MKIEILFGVLLAVVAYAESNCGCLKCSKHLYVASPPGAPIKIIYRTEPGSYAGGNGRESLAYNVQAPQMQMQMSGGYGSYGKGYGYKIDQVQMLPYSPVVSIPCIPPKTYDYKVQAPIQVPLQLCVPKPIKGRATVDRIVLPAPIQQCATDKHHDKCQQANQPIRQPIIETLVPTYTACEYSGYRYVPKISSQKLLGNFKSFQKHPRNDYLDLREDNLSNLGINSNNFNLLSEDHYLRCKRSISDNFEPRSSTAISDKVGIEGKLDNGLPEKLDDENIEHNKDKIDSVRSNIQKHIKIEGTSKTKDSQNETGPPNSRKKRHIPIISTGINLLMGLIPPFIKTPIQQSLRGMSKDFNQRLAQQRRNRIQQQKYADREARRFNPYVGLQNNHRSLPYYPYREIPPPLAKAYTRRPLYQLDDNYADDLEDDFLSSLTSPSYKPQMYLRQKEPEARRPLEGSRLKGLREKYGKGDMSQMERETFLKKLQKLNGRSLRNRRSVRFDEEENEKQFFRHGRRSQREIDKDFQERETSSSIYKPRNKRSLILDGSELGLPFFRVRKYLDNDIEKSGSNSEEYLQEYDSDQDSSEYFFESGSSEEYGREPPRRTRKKDRHKESYTEDEHSYLQPFNADHMIPHNPIFYFLNTPIRLLHHFHGFQKQLSPILKSVPRVLINTRRYLQDFGKTFESGVMDFASNLFGNFEDQPHYQYNSWNNIVSPSRFRRSLASTEEVEDERFSEADQDNQGRSNELEEARNSILKDKMNSEHLSREILEAYERKEEYKMSSNNIKILAEDYKPNEDLSSIIDNSSKSSVDSEEIEDSHYLDDEAKSKKLGTLSPEYEIVFGNLERNDSLEEVMKLDEKDRYQEDSSKIQSFTSGSGDTNISREKVFAIREPKENVSSSESYPFSKEKTRNQHNALNKENEKIFPKESKIFVSQEDSDYLDDDNNFSTILSSGEEINKFESFPPLDFHYGDSKSENKILLKNEGSSSFISLGNLQPDYEKVFEKTISSENYEDNSEEESFEEILKGEINKFLPDFHHETANSDSKVLPKSQGPLRSLSLGNSQPNYEKISQKITSGNYEDTSEDESYKEMLKEEINKFLPDFNHETTNSDSKVLPKSEVSLRDTSLGNLQPDYENIFKKTSSENYEVFSEEKTLSEMLKDENFIKSISSGRLSPEYSFVFGENFGEENLNRDDSLVSPFGESEEIKTIDRLLDEISSHQNVNQELRNSFASQIKQEKVNEDSLNRIIKESLQISELKKVTNEEDSRINTSATLKIIKKELLLTNLNASNTESLQEGNQKIDGIKNLPDNIRNKRYILKMVNDGDVESFLRDKLTQIVSPYFEDFKTKPKKKKIKKHEQDSEEIHKKPSKQRYVIEKLYPKIIIDNNGIPFVEIDGQKRPMFFKKKKHYKEENSEEFRYKNIYKKSKRGCKNCGEEKSDSSSSSASSASSEEINLGSRISNLIDEAKKHAETVDKGQNTYYSEMPVKTIKERISQLLGEIQDLITMDFDPYVAVYTELLRLEHLKDTICEEWKQMVMTNRIDDMNCKIRLLDDFKKLQLVKDEVVKIIAELLKCDNSDFMTKKLIKMLIRLQKLQCIIFKVVEDAEDKLNSETNFDIQREIKYIEYLCQLKFVIGRSRNDLEDDLKKERDQDVENDMEQIEKLRELLECQDGNIISDEARLLWEIKNMEKLQHDAIESLNNKIKNKQKIRKELKILFDLQRQIETNEEKQKELLKKLKVYNKKKGHGYEYYAPQNEKIYKNIYKNAEVKNKYNAKRNYYNEDIFGKRTKRTKKSFNRHHPFIEDDRAVKIASNGYKMTGYKLEDSFD